MAAAWGQMATGGGYATLKESMLVIGVLIITKKSLIQTECATAIVSGGSLALNNPCMMQLRRRGD